MSAPESPEAGQERIVLIGVDGSETAEHAFDWYAKHLHRPENKVIVVHTIEVHNVHAYPSVFVNPQILQAEFEKEKEKAHGLEEKYKDKLKKLTVNGEYRTECGKAGEVLVHLGEQQNVEMLVVGTRGHGKIRRTILGSVSDYCIHHAHCPVATVRKSAPI